LTASDPVRLRIDLAYDGTPFAGFSRQPDQHTVQGTLEGALWRLLGVVDPTEGGRRGRMPAAGGVVAGLTVAGRTDRGVHALGQVCHVDVRPLNHRAELALGDLPRLQARLDQAAGRSVTIWSVTRVPSAFDARFSAVWRAYRYRIIDASRIEPLRHHDAWHVPEGPLALRAMQQAAKHLIGTHDYASFCRNRDGKTTMRRLDTTAVVRAAPGEVHLKFRGKAFCQQQVRAMVGALVEVGLGKRDPAWIAELLAARSRKAAAAVAPAHGLTLEAVGYERPFPASPLGR